MTHESSDAQTTLEALPCLHRRELLAVVATLDHFKGYVWGPKFLVRIDHATSMAQ